MLAARCQRFYMAGEPTVWLRMPLTHLAFFSAEIEPLKAEDSIRRVAEWKVAFAPAGEDGYSAQLIYRDWQEKVDREDRIAREEQPKMTKEEYDAMLRMTGVARREWVIKDG